MKKLLLIDGHSVAFRAFYALPVESFRTSSGQATNAFYGFFVMLLNILESEKPDYLAVAFDEKRPTFRTQLFPGYKAQRKPTPDDFKTQIPLLKDMLDILGITWLSNEEYEADDVIATLAYADPKMKVNIVTGDRDSFQLVNDRISVLYPRKGVSELDIYTPDKVKEKYGVSASQYADFAALRGDNSDNLPGVPGVGEKTATKWIDTYGSLAGVIENAAEIKGKVGEALRDNIDQVKLNRELTEMVKDVPLLKQIDDLVIKDFQLQKFNDLANNLELKSLKSRIKKKFAGEIENEKLEETNNFAEKLTELNFVNMDLESVMIWLKKISSGSVLFLDFLLNTEKRIESILLLNGNDLITFKVTESSYLDEIFELFEQITLAKLEVVGHSLKPALRQLNEIAVSIPKIAFDTELAAYLLQPSRRSYDLAELLATYLHISAELSVEKPPSEQLNLLDTLSVDTISSIDKEISAFKYLPFLYEKLSADLGKIGQLDLLTSMDIPVMLILAKMEALGIGVDSEEIASLITGFGLDAENSKHSALKLVRHEINLSSPKQLQEVIFTQFQMPKTKKTKTGYTTDAAALADLYVKTSHPFLQDLLAFREKIKLKQVVESLQKSVAADERIHSTFMQTVTTTGRLSSIDPNLQNIPVRTADGKKIREVFIPQNPAKIFLTADYSQIEMRIMAHLSKDDLLIKAFREGEDLHNYVGAEIFGVDKDEVTPELRRRVKAISYGLAYGLSAYGLAKQLNISNKEAQSHMHAYFARFGKVKAYLEEVVEKARESGFTETIYGRRRYLPDLNSSNSTLRQMAERAALNAPIQGSSADIIKMAMVRINEKLLVNNINSKLLLQIHDELLFEVYPQELEKLKKIVEEEMCSVIDLLVPLEVSVGVGENWQAAAH